jgi:hypothetical protein
MDYGRVYEQFIEDRRNKPVPVKGEQHHILPRCLGGGDEPENIIRLSYADHLFAHVLLARIHGGVLVQSAVRMSGMRKYNGGRRSRERYAHLRAKLREEMLGNTRGRGLVHTEEFKKAVGDRNRGIPFAKGWKWSPERREAHRQRMLGNKINSGKKRPHQPETIEKLRQRALARSKNVDA